MGLGYGAGNMSVGIFEFDLEELLGLRKLEDYN